MPLERGDRELSNGTKIIKNGSILRKLQSNRVDRNFDHEFLVHTRPNSGFNVPHELLFSHGLGRVDLNVDLKKTFQM